MICLCWDCVLDTMLLLGDMQMVKRILTALICMAVLYGCTQLDLKGIFMPTGVGVEARFEQSKAIHEDLCTGTVDDPD